MATEHHINVETDEGTKVMSFTGLAVPRAGDIMKLTSTPQKIHGEYEVTRVRWMVTNAGSGSNKFVSQAQAEVWVVPFEEKPVEAPRRWPRHLALAILLLTVAGAAVAYLQGVIP